MRDMKIGPLTGLDWGQRNGDWVIPQCFCQMQSDLQNVHNTRILWYYGMDSGLGYSQIQTSMSWDVAIAMGRSGGMKNRKGKKK